MEPAAIIRDIHQLNHQLERFERKYGLLSRTFYETYTAGQEPVCGTSVLDFAEWAGLYEIWCDRQKSYVELVKRLRERDTNLFNHIQSV